MPNWKRAAVAVMIFPLCFGALFAAPGAARADDKPIIVGKPIIHPDPKPQPKGNVVSAGAQEALA